MTPTCNLVVLLQSLVAGCRFRQETNFKEKRNGFLVAGGHSIEVIRSTAGSALLLMQPRLRMGHTSRVIGFLVTEERLEIFSIA